MKKYILLFFCMFVFAGALAQNSITGTVTSATDGEPLSGVTVKVKGQSALAITDIDGNFKINAGKGDRLELSYIGFVTHSHLVKGLGHLDLKMTPDNNGLDEVVVLGYGQSKRITLTGAVSAINGKELQKVPVSSVQNTLAGKLPGFFSQQRSGQPGRDASDFFIRGVSSLNPNGNKPLIIVDDVEYSYDQLSQININEIESISILKDASTTAIYGIKGANGVLVVKTRRGIDGRPRINVRMEGGMQTPVRTPKFLNSFETASLVNEAYTNDGLQPLFSESDLNHFRTGDDPYGHPDVNWYKEIFKKMAWQRNTNLDISGGSERLKYFVSLGQFSQSGLMRDFSTGTDGINTNYNYRRFNFRTNLDFKVTDNLSMRLDVTSRFMNINEPHGMNTTGEIYNFEKMHPYSAPVINPNGTYAYIYDTSDHKPTLNARLANEGYNRTRRNDNNLLYQVNWKMDFITEGLSSSARLAYSTIDETYRSVFRGQYPTYHYDSASDSYTINPDGHYSSGTWAVGGGTNTAKKSLNLLASINYARVFNKVHDVNAMLLYNRQSDTNEKDDPKVPTKFTGVTAKLSYKYASKYLIDFNAAYNGSDRFSADNRYGFFPAVGVGYVMSEEKWFRNIVGKAVEHFKIRASYGIVGSDVAPGDRYLYKNVYKTGDSYSFGENNNQGSQGYREGDLANDHVTWEKAKKFDIGIDLNLFNRISITVDYFHDNRYDQLVYRNDIPLIIGAGSAPLNVAKTENWGFDGQVGFRDQWGDFGFNSNFVFSFAKNKVLYKAEAQQRYPWLASTGRSIGQEFGYKWIGYYTPEDIKLIKSGAENAPAVPNTDVPVQAGDLKYKDLNHDGVINDYDKGAIGKPNLPNTTLGWTIGGTWKGFSLSVLFQGSFNYSFSIKGTGIEPFKSQFQPLHEKRWTLERWQNGEDIEFPRLTSNPSTVNSAEAYMSDFWLIDAWYIRLKTVDLSYDFPRKWVPKFMSGLRLYANCYNLFTWTSYKKYQQDPEIQTNSAGDAYMNQRVVNFGVNISF